MTLAVQPLSVELKSSTRVAHERAEHSTFMSDLLEGKLDAQAFIALQQQSWLMYSALEEAVAAVRETGFAADLLDPVLDRKASLEADLELLTGADWEGKIIALPATLDYVARLNDIAATADGARLVAHHYVRYLGDLSGGQVIARMVQRHYGVAPEALSFYRFDGIQKLKPYKDNYRASLDALELSDAQRAQLLDEAADAFIFNHNMFADLGKHV
ncbi:MAG: biliverdin-producing heme oxygenase [Corynebacterium sp.]|nr:biliverdin-producing heme oxygenase [Corynebacterium sp.]